MTGNTGTAQPSWKESDSINALISRSHRYCCSGEHCRAHADSFTRHPSSIVDVDVSTPVHGRGPMYKSWNTSRHAETSQVPRLVKPQHKLFFAPVVDCFEANVCVLYGATLRFSVCQLKMRFLTRNLRERRTYVLDVLLRLHNIQVPLHNSNVKL